MGNQTAKTVFERDFGMASIAFPKLSYTPVRKNGWSISGDLDICDRSGMYWGTFQIEIRVPASYPYCVPDLYEKSKIIPWDIDFHINEQGWCCVDIGHRLLYRAKSGISILTFLTEWVYPFFANYLYRVLENKYANGEYAHSFEGVKQFYQEDLKLSADEAVNLLSQLVSKSSVGRNDDCPCGSGKKLKRCHLYAYELLKALGYARIQLDYDGFMKSKPDT